MQLQLANLRSWKEWLVLNSTEIKVQAIERLGPFLISFQALALILLIDPHLNLFYPLTFVIFSTTSHNKMTGKQAATTLLRGARRFASTSAATATRTPPHLLTLADLSPAQIGSVLQSAIEFKDAFRSVSQALPEGSRKQLGAGESPINQSLKNKSIAIMFSKRSTRTRVASETSVASLGGTGLFLAPSDIQLGVNESLYDTAKVVSSMVDGIMARVGGHDEVEVGSSGFGFTARRPSSIEQVLTTRSFLCLFVMCRTAVVEALDCSRHQRALRSLPPYPNPC